MTGHTRRWALLFVALAMLAVALVACGQPGGYALPNARSAALMSTPAISSSPTPASAPFTIGTWPSNSMPAAGKSVTIYIICQIQDPTMARPNQPAAGQPVSVRLLDPVNRTYTGTTGDSGIATVRVAFNHARARIPITVIVTSTWKGATYQSQTSFTPASSTGSSGDGALQPGETPPIPAPTATPAPNPGPTATPTPAPPAPSPTPTPTPAPPPSPTPTPIPEPTATPVSPLSTPTPAP
ncbi:MAG TPA: hypothetical protein VFQ32_13475 [Ktedonobacterales bacterium]|nr:hypothetical protein [Ktedonobacterales bacterium]